MSLETVIQENTNALRDLIAAIANGIPTTSAQVAAVATQAAEKVEAKAEKKSAQAEKPASSESGATPQTATETAAPAVVLDYEAIKKPFLSLVNKKGRDAAAALLNQFGVDAGKGGKLSDIPADKYADVLAAIETAGA
ncbi:hypothetical protein SKTS_19200 [Sulfurimicrobium lacus]|uniref:Uncharacterized protein n=1 Tax=Sulfurimicrobium lacus TaxID=2715678 RepID=A0A6F8VBJ5_9PROT|nr:hypothetical protein [Sulfurimicrobium lacus]BCB27034.1 hypothetical protein SKTS_19200 [Sulfurimicrobium lacus]